MNRAIEAMLRSGYALQGRTQTSATFTRKDSPSFFLGCLLMLFLIVPGVLYLIFGGSEATVTMAAYPAPKGYSQEGTRVVIGGDKQHATFGLRDWALRLASETSA